MTHHDRELIERRIDARIHETLEYWIEQLGRLCAQPSISAQQLGIAECAELTATMLREQGFAAEILPTGGSPIVFGERAGLSDRTLLFYNHYDVQPPEPLELWNSGPFDPVIKDGKIYARGSCDDKGQVYMHVKALETLIQTNSLQNNIKFCIDIGLKNYLS